MEHDPTTNRHFLDRSLREGSLTNITRRFEQKLHVHINRLLQNKEKNLIMSNSSTVPESVRTIDPVTVPAIKSDLSALETVSATENPPTLTTSDDHQLQELYDNLYRYYCNLSEECDKLVEKVGKVVKDYEDLSRLLRSSVAHSPLLTRHIFPPTVVDSLSLTSPTDSTRHTYMELQEQIVHLQAQVEMERQQNTCLALQLQEERHAKTSIQKDLVAAQSQKVQLEAQLEVLFKRNTTTKLNGAATETETATTTTMMMERACITNDKVDHPAQRILQLQQQLDAKRYNSHCLRRLIAHMEDKAYDTVSSSPTDSRFCTVLATKKEKASQNEVAKLQQENELFCRFLKSVGEQTHSSLGEESTDKKRSISSPSMEAFV